MTEQLEFPRHRATYLNRPLREEEYVEIRSLHWLEEELAVVEKIITDGEVSAADVQKILQGFAVTCKLSIFIALLNRNLDARRLPYRMAYTDDGSEEKGPYRFFRKKDK